jgi:hypothetical protein
VRIREESKVLWTSMRWISTDLRRFVWDRQSFVSDKFRPALASSMWETPLQIQTQSARELQGTLLLVVEGSRDQELEGLRPKCRC